MVTLLMTFDLKGPNVDSLWYLSRQDIMKGNGHINHLYLSRQDVTKVMCYGHIADH